MEGDPLLLSLELAGLPQDAVLEFDLPAADSGITVGAFLDEVFPPDEAAQQDLEESFDLQTNPDLQEIYAEFLAVVQQFRNDLCSLTVSAPSGQVMSPDDLLDDLLSSAPPGSPTRLSLFLTADYDALEYAGAQGYDAGVPDLLHWLRVCVALYFIEKHESPLPAQESLNQCQPLASAVDEILSRGLVEVGNETSGPVITPDGRRFIGNLLSETEQLVDAFDLFKDVYWDEDSGQALFGTGQGDDLRVEVFIAESIDPVRAVFLLRLYDGTLDEFVGCWLEVAGDLDFFNTLLLPVVDRSVTEESLLEEILEQGMDLLESERQEFREEETYRRAASSHLSADG
ncbi:MAG: hypothetical protein OXE17_12535 [Chloroflexi bacterium]|nr:hypothetical protein [Chloroflexota bacterium]